MFFIFHHTILIKFTPASLYGFRWQQSSADILTYATLIWNRLSIYQMWHAPLLYKLPAYGIPPKLGQWTSNVLSGQSIPVVLVGHALSLHKISASAPQRLLQHSSKFILMI